MIKINFEKVVNEKKVNEICLQYVSKPNRANELPLINSKVHNAFIEKYSEIDGFLFVYSVNTGKQAFFEKDNTLKAFYVSMEMLKDINLFSSLFVKVSYEIDNIETVDIRYKNRAILKKLSPYFPNTTIDYNLLNEQYGENYGEKLDNGSENIFDNCVKVLNNDLIDCMIDNKKIQLKCSLYGAPSTNTVFNYIVSNKGKIYKKNFEKLDTRKYR